MITQKFQVVILKDVRNRLKLKPGQKLRILQFGDRMEFVPVRDLKEMKGFLKVIDTNIQRKKDRA